MSNLVAFDQKGAFGPAITLIYNSQNYNAKGLFDLANLLKANFTNLANMKPKGKKEFCAFVLEKNQTQAPITPADVISTKFFQSMQKADPSPLYHEKVLGFIVPSVMRTAKEHFLQTNNDQEAQEINEWSARFIECYMTEEQIKKHCELQDSVPEKIMEERKRIGMELYKLATTQNFTEKDLDLLVKVSQFALENLQNAEHFATTLNFTGRYLTLFSMNEENPLVLGEDALRLLSTVFKEKVFPKKE